MMQLAWLQGIGNMNIEEIAALVNIRNHIAFLINNDRATVPKDKVREASKIQTKLDKLIFDSVLEVYGEKPEQEPAKSLVKAEEPVKAEADKPAEPTPSAKVTRAKVATQDDEEVAKRLAEAKKQLKKTDKSKSSAAVTKRTENK